MTTCSMCGEECSAGYGKNKAGEIKCYACCAVSDLAYMDEHGEIWLYLTKDETGPKVTNWPGSLSFPCYVRKGRHNIAGTRYDVWFTDRQGSEWHGVQYGENTQICRCRKIKGRK